MLQRVLFLIIFVCFSIDAMAFDIETLGHVPPKVQAGDDFSAPLRLTIPGHEIKKARVLLATPTGYRAIPMIKAARTYEAEVFFGDFAVVSYLFQVETISGQVHESKRYSIRQPADAELEGKISALRTQYRTINARRKQLENAIHNLKNADPQALGRRKDQELARALVILGKRERVLNELSEEVESSYGQVENELSKTERGQAVSEARDFQLKEFNAAWAKQGNR